MYVVLGQRSFGCSRVRPIVIYTEMVPKAATRSGGGVDIRPRGANIFWPRVYPAEEYAVTRVHSRVPATKYLRRHGVVRVCK